MNGHSKLTINFRVRLIGFNSMKINAETFALKTASCNRLALLVVMLAVTVHSVLLCAVDHVSFIKLECTVSGDATQAIFWSFFEFLKISLFALLLLCVT